MSRGNLTPEQEFAMLLCQAAWEVGKSADERLQKVMEILCIWGETHPLPPLPEGESAPGGMSEK